MNLLDVMQAAFRDELEKIAYVRAGRKPISIDRMLERETEVESPSAELGLVEDVVEEEPKVASAGAASKAGNLLKNVPKRDAALLLGGAAAYHQGRKIKRRYDIGRQVEQQGGY